MALLPAESDIHETGSKCICVESMDGTVSTPLIFTEFKILFSEGLRVAVRIQDFPVERAPIPKGAPT